MARPHDDLPYIEDGAPKPVSNTSTDRLFGLTEPLPTTGKHSGFVKIPYSSDMSAYGFVPVPLAIVGGGDGPTVLLLAGVFGDEIDAQIALVRVAQALDADAMQGRVIILTMANTPAARTGTRTSPIDGRNLNKSFPGSVMGTPTSMIADYIERHLMSSSDIVLDLHSDGRSLRYIPSVTLVEHLDPDVHMRRMAVMRAFGAPNMLMFRSYEDRSTSGAARRAGAVRVATEIGGPDPVQTMVDGVMRVLDWAGIINGAAPSRVPSNAYLGHREDDFVYALHDGVFEPALPLGATVKAGDVAGHIHDLTRPFSPPAPVHFAVDGVVVCTRGPGLTARGDCLMHLALPADEETLARIRDAGTLRWLKTQTQARLKKRAPVANARKSKP